MKHPEHKHRVATIGRPGIGGEFLDVAANGLDRFELRRFKKVSAHNDEPRQFGMGDLPASTLVYDLLSAIEGIVRYAEAENIPLHLDDHGLAGNRPSVRERLMSLAIHAQHPKRRQS